MPCSCTERRPTAEGRSGYKITLQYPSYSAILDYADDRALREKLYRAYVTRASELGNPDWNNGPLIVELLRLRQEHAQLLGYSSFAEVSLVPKMAATPVEVLHFLRDLGTRARPYAERDVAEVRQFAAEQLGLADVTPWDFSYASEKLREARYAYSDQELKRYFTEPRVLAGLFKVIETLFGVAIREEPTPTWHPDVRFFRIESSRGELVGQFYLDLYARDHKQGGAWHSDARSRRGRRTGLATPVSYLTCNFSRPVGGRPATFKHDEVLTLFHEFGHGLHHMLTRVDEPAVAGLHGVEWDAVELAEPVHGELRLGVGSPAASDRPCGHRRTPAPAALRQDDCRAQLPERLLYRSPARVRAVRHAAPCQRGACHRPRGPAGAGGGPA